MEVITQQPDWFKDALAKDHRDDFIEVEGAFGSCVACTLAC